MAVPYLARPPRPRSRGAGNLRTSSANAPSFLPRPAKGPPQLEQATVIPQRVSSPEPPPPQPTQPLKLGSPPRDLSLPSGFPPGFSSSPTRSLSHPNSTLPPMGPLRQVRRSRSEAPPLPTCLEDGVEDIGFSRPPLVRNVASFEKPREYSKALGKMPSPRRQAPLCSRPIRSARRNRIDEAIQREMIGDGIALEEAVDARRDAGWAVKQRHLQRSDIGHCCYACRQPLRDMNEEVVVWTGAAIYRRFHPQCAASYVLRTDTEKSSALGGGRDSVSSDVVEGYADGWRALPRDDTMGSGRSRRAVDAARQWLLSQDPSAFSELRGDLFTTVTITENGKKKAVPGLSHEQLLVLQTKHKWKFIDHSDEALDNEDCLECPICFASLDSQSPACIRLPCAPQHVCHVDCVLPWLRKACICPVCRKDLRPLLPPSRGTTR